MTTTACLRALGCLLFVAVLAIGGCQSGPGSSSSEQAPSPSPPTNAETQAPPEPAPDPEIERQKQQVAQALSKCETALQLIYEKKKKAKAALTAALEDYLADDTEGQESKMKKADAIRREQDRSKREFAKWQEELRKLEKSQYPEVREEAARALGKTEEKARRFEKGLPPNS